MARPSIKLPKLPKIGRRTAIVGGLGAAAVFAMAALFNDGSDEAPAGSAPATPATVDNDALRAAAEPEITLIYSIVARDETPLRFERDAEPSSDMTLKAGSCVWTYQDPTRVGDEVLVHIKDPEAANGRGLDFSAFVRDGDLKNRHTRGNDALGHTENCLATVVQPTTP